MKGKIFKGKEILKAPDGVYLIFWNDGSFRKYCCKNDTILSFFGTQYYLDLEKKSSLDVVDSIELLNEGT